MKTAGVSAAGTIYDGNGEKDGVRNTSLSGHLGYSLTRDLSIDISIRTIRTKLDIDNFGGNFGDDPNNLQDYDATLFKAELRGLFLKSRWEQKLSFSIVDYDRRQSNPVDPVHPLDSEDARFESRMYKLSWQNNLFLHETNTLTFGMEHQIEQGESEYHSMSLFGPFSSVFPFQKAWTTSLYIQDQIRLGGMFFATVGSRLDFHSQFVSTITFRIAPSYLIKSTDTRFKATYGTGFKAPSLYQLYAPPTFYAPVGNGGLEPEKSSGWDVGIEQSLLSKKMLLGITYFNNSYKNLILYDYLSGFFNVGRAYSRGIEAFVRMKPLMNLTVSAEYTSTHAKDRDTDEYLLRRPRNKFTTRVQWDFLDNAWLSLNMIYTGKRQDMMWIGWTPTLVTMGDFLLLNAALTYELSKGFELFLRVDNILDAEYELVKGYGTYGRAFYTGFQVKL
ncbi:TonB-dependent receptor plug domain-containing protein [Acidobacteriota bacterium]